MTAVPSSRRTRARAASARHADVDEEFILVLQGGGALGAYQAGVFEAMSQVARPPDWIAGISIGAINAALIAGNPPERRVERLHEFWQMVSSGAGQMLPNWSGERSLLNQWSAASAIALGIRGFFEPRVGPALLLGGKAPVLSYYDTAPLKATLERLVDFDRINHKDIRFSVGAVNVRTGNSIYFDNLSQTIGPEHIMASGALPPGFPPVMVKGKAYWDGGIYSNTPIEAVLDDRPRRDALIFAVNVWHQTAPEPESIWQVMGRTKDIQFASRADSHIARQKQIHRLRHVIRQLTQQLSASKQADPAVKELSSWGCGTTMHVAHLLAPRLESEDHTKDIDFSPSGVKARREAGYSDTLSMIERSPWREPTDPIEGVVEHR